MKVWNRRCKSSSLLMSLCVFDHSMPCLGVAFILMKRAMSFSDRFPNEAVLFKQKSNLVDNSLS